MRDARRVRTTLGLLLAVVLVLSIPVILRDDLRHPALGANVRLIEPSASPEPTPTPTRVLPLRGPALIRPANDSSGFSHPGVLVTSAQLEFVRDRVNAGDQPWAGAFEDMRDSEFAQLGWSPRPRSVVECGPYSRPDLGCRDEWRDGIAAYTHALLWYLTGHPAHAMKATALIDAWSGVLTSHIGHNAPIQAAWSGVPFVRAAEIMRHTYAGWPAAQADRAAQMFRTAFLPLVGAGGARGTWGNWDLIILDAAIGIAVHLDDRGLFDSVVAKWRARLPAYIYLSGDGSYPVRPPGGAGGRAATVDFWFGQSTFVDGLTQETCRDLGHTGWGLAALTHVAETAWIQGVDLYAEAEARVVSALELHSRLSLGEPVPNWLCSGQVKEIFTPAPEIALNHYANRLAIPMPNTAQFVSSRRPQRASHFYAWETLTHGGNPR
jgi:hypothetical protein